MPETVPQAALRWAPAVAALATLAAVLVALFRESIFLRVRRPRLTVRISGGPPDCHKTAWTLPDGGMVPCYFLRVQVENTGRTTAHRVEAFLSDVSCRGPDGTFGPTEPRFLPMGLLWSHTKLPYAEALVPHMPRHCDLAYVMQPAVSLPRLPLPAHIPRDKTYAVLETEVKPNTGSSFLSPGTYRLELRVGADNAKPQSFRIDLAVNGEWFTDEDRMLSEGVSVACAPASSSEPKPSSPH